MGSATSCIALVPGLLARMEPSNQMLNVMKPTAIAKDINAIRFAVLDETKSEKIRMDPGTHASAPNLIGAISFYSILLYNARIKSAIGSSMRAYSWCFLSSFIGLDSKSAD